LGLTGSLDPGTRLYYSRPYQVLDAGRFANAVFSTITYPLIMGLPPIGAASQFMDSTPALGEPSYPRAVITACWDNLRPAAIAQLPPDRDVSVLGVRGIQT